MREHGQAIAGAGIILALAVLFGLGSILIIEQSNFYRSAITSVETASKQTHESLSIHVTRNPENTEIMVQNEGSVNSFVVKAIAEETDTSLTEYHIESVGINVNENSTIVLENCVDDNTLLGLITLLGNVFWED